MTARPCKDLPFVLVKYVLKSNQPCTRPSCWAVVSDWKVFSWVTVLFLKVLRIIAAIYILSKLSVCTFSPLVIVNKVWRMWPQIIFLKDFLKL